MADIKVYTLDEVADILKITKRTLYTYVKSGMLHAVKMGKYWRVPERSLQAFVNADTPILEENRRKENRSANKG